MKKKSSFLSTVCVIAFAFLMLSIFIQLTNGGLFKSFALVHDGNYIYKDESTIECLDGTDLNIGVKQFGELKEVMAKIYAVADKDNDFKFSYGGQEYSWNETVAGMEVSELLDLTVLQANGDNNARVTFKISLENILNEVSYGEAVVFESLPEDNLLKMDIYSGEEKISVFISIKVCQVTALNLSVTEIIF